MYTEEKTLFQRFIENLDWILIAVVVFLIFVGFMGIYSATLHYGNSSRFMITQGAAIVFGMVGLIVLLTFNYQYFRSLLYMVYGISIFMLILVLIAGTTIKGTRGWFNLGYFSFQPVEMTKLMFILVLAGYLDSQWRDTKRITSMGIALLLLLGHLFFILLQPDFSSTLSYIPITLVLLFVAGIGPIYLFAAALFGSLAAGIPLLATYFRLQPDLLQAHSLLNYIIHATRGGIPAVIVLSFVVMAIFMLWWLLKGLRMSIPVIYPAALSLIIVFGSFSSVVVQKSLREYQRKRLIVFLNPEIDPLGSGYNIIQSKIAIGSGQMFGKGLFSGTQSQLGFLPEQHTDFIFSVLGEETGFLFSFPIIGAYFLLVWRALLVAREARDRYGSYVAIGIATMFAFYGIINIGMVMGLMPATGLPLPFLSYGGSSIASSLWAIGILLSIHIRRFTN